MISCETASSCAYTRLMASERNLHCMFGYDFLAEALQAMNAEPKIPKHFKPLFLNLPF